jgi:hypothetical protein
MITKSEEESIMDESHWLAHGRLSYKASETQPDTSVDKEKC